ncbi:hypothetical protein CTI14_29430 [Methylobacterium radiotolerans]|nr:hypothetical protein CTI14_29430 [Methylobacterium radiotolerans]
MLSTPRLSSTIGMMRAPGFASPRAIKRITVTSETRGKTKKNQTRAPSSSPTTMKTGTQRSIQGPSSAMK